MRRRRFADWLRQEGHDVVESKERGPDEQPEIEKAVKQVERILENQK